MYYIYYPYVLIVSMAMAAICHKQKNPLWWSAAVFFAPVTTPYFIVQFQKRGVGKWIVFFFISFLLVVGIEGCIWFQNYKQNQFARLNPVDRTAILITRDIESNISEMNAIMESLDIKDRVATGKKDIINSRDSIKRARILMEQGHKLTKQFVIFVTDHAPYFQQTHQNWALELKKFYQSSHMIKYYSTTTQYLNEFKHLLDYVETHFEKIKNHHSQAIKNYDQYFIRYRQGLDRYKKYADGRMKSQTVLIKKYPELKKYLPAKVRVTAVKMLM